MSTAETALTDPYDQLSEEFVQNPYPTYLNLRNQTPLLKSPNAARWLFSRYNDVNTLVRGLTALPVVLSGRNGTAAGVVLIERYSRW